MSAVRSCDLPDDALLRKYLLDGAYADCYFIDVARPVSQAGYVQAFYTSGVFRIERALLGWFVSRPSTDQQAAELAGGTLETFAAWRVEARTPDQLLLCDFMGRTRSWLMSCSDVDRQTTRLYFGSAVVPASRHRTGKASMGLLFRALLGFHQPYSRILLRAAATRVTHGASC
jgi:hypothetical protein